MAPERLLEVRGLSVAYATAAGPVVAVDTVDLDLDAGEFMAVVGESGCGKSTLLFAITRLLTPPGGITAGSVRFRGRDMVDMTEKQLRHVRWKEYSVVMQSAMNALNPVTTVGGQMRDALRAHADLGDEEIAARSAEVLRLVSIDPLHLRSYPHQLSGGMRQRAMIAMALLFTPQLVIMDEPTSALDVVAQRSLMHQIKDLQQRLGFAVFFVTHDMSLVRRFSDRLTVMYAGQVVETGPTERIFDDPSHPYARGLLEAFPTVRGPKVELAGIPGSPPDLAHPPAGCRFRPRCPDAFADCASDPPPLYERGPLSVRCLLYRGGAEAAPAARARSARPQQPAAAAAASPPAARPLLEATGLTRHFRLGGPLARRTLHAVDDASFTIGEREIVALVGESGSGKSTVARLITMVHPPTAGEIRFEGRSLAELRRRKARLAYRGLVPMIFQDPYSSLNPAFRVGHAVTRAIRLHRPDLRSRAALRAEAVRVMEAVGMVPGEAMLGKYPYELSGGQRQRVGFAQALALRPKLIVADEPVSMLDVSIRVGILNLMAKLRAETGVSFLYITHDVASARYVADRVLVLYAGHLVEEGPTEQVLADPRHPYTKLLLAAVPDPTETAGSEVPTDSGEPPRVVDPVPGCRFAPRCPEVVAVCTERTPLLDAVGAGRRAACHVAQAQPEAVRSPSPS